MRRCGGWQFRSVDTIDVENVSSGLMWESSHPLSLPRFVHVECCRHATTIYCRRIWGNTPYGRVDVRKLVPCWCRRRLRVRTWNLRREVACRVGVVIRAYITGFDGATVPQPARLRRFPRRLQVAVVQPALSTSPLAGYLWRQRWYGVRRAVPVRRVVVRARFLFALNRSSAVIATATVCAFNANTWSAN